MNSEINNIFNKTSCLTFQEIEKYVSGNLSKEETRQIELHLADCPMCNDQIDGYSLLQDKNTLPHTVEKINKQINEKINNLKVIPIRSASKKTFTKRFISIAASLILIAGGGYIINFYLNSGNKNLAEIPASENKNKQTAEENTSVFENKTKPENKNIKTTEKQENNKLSEQKNTTIDEISTNNNINEEINTSETENKTQNEKNNAVTNEISENTLDISEEEITTETNNNDIVAETSPAENNFFATSTRGTNFKKNDKKTKEKYKSMRESALLSYDMKIYDEALKDFNNYLKYKPADYEILYKSGFSYYKLKKYDKAISRFDKVIFEGINKYTEDARWYKAKSLIKLDKKEDAKTILNLIITKNGKYQNQALNLLNTL